MNYYIYKIVNTVNDKIYIGQTTESLEKRFSRHIGYQLKDKNYNSKIHRAMLKYGIDKFSIHLIEEVNNQDELNKREYYWIHKLDTIKNGYNINDSGFKCGGDTLTNNPNLKKIAKKISESTKGKLNHNAKKIFVKNIEDNKEYIFYSVEDCVREFNFKNHTRICFLAKNNKLNKEEKLYKHKWLFKYID